ncbi:MAG: cation:proton antiporter [Acidobacteria bacterium]|nr:cation:proton antiporter [Acidobacteriota bacterium]
MFDSFFQQLHDHAPALAVLATLVLVLLAGTSAQILAERMRVPATGPLLVAGLLFGPAVLGLVQPELLGVTLRVVVRAAVAVVVFEGGLLLKVSELRHTSRAVAGLVSVGLLITTLLAALLVNLLLGWSWELSLLFGAIVSVTGPTVITPILQKVRVNRRVRTTLESESVIADPLGVILAALVFTAITTPGGWQYAALHGLTTLAAKEQVEEFKGDLASIAISAVFVLLAASLELGDLARLGWRGAAVVALLMLVVRPVRVFLSTWGSELRRNEKWFISFLGPRGIVAASVATFFALELTDAGYVEGRLLVSLVFAVVLATVLIEGSAVGWLARRFKVMPKHTIIVGADEAGRLLAAELNRAGETVSLIDLDPEACAAAGELKGVSLYCDDATDAGVLRRAGAEDAKCLIAATSSDKVNLLVCQVARASFGRDNRKMRLVARANNSSNMGAFEAAGIETMSPARAAATILENMVLRPSLLRLLAAGAEPEDVIEVTVEREGSAGKTLAELALHGCVVAALKRAERLVVPNGSTRLREGDVLTIIGSEPAVNAAREKLDGTN